MIRVDHQDVATMKSAVIKTEDTLYRRRVKKVTDAEETTVGHQETITTNTKEDKAHVIVNGKEDVQDTIAQVNRESAVPLNQTNLKK